MPEPIRQGQDLASDDEQPQAVHRWQVHQGPLNLAGLEES